MKEPERSLKDTAPPKEGMLREFGSQTKLARSAGKVRLECPICGLSFSRYASQIKKNAAAYCGRACHAASQVVRIESNCKVCGKAMLQKPSNVARVVTCGAVCSHTRRRKPGAALNRGSVTAYQAAAAAVAARGECCKCGVKHGPWAVRGLLLIDRQGELPTVESEAAALWCRHCHLVDIAPTGRGAPKP